MASPFFRSLRFLEADNFRRSYLLLLLTAALLGLWMAWFFLARVSLSEVSDRADLEVAQSAHPVEAAASGRVVASHMVLEQEVKAGEVLVDLDSSAQQLLLNEQQTQAAGAAPEARSLEQEIASERQAGEQEQAAAQQALEEARAHYREAEAAAQFAQTESERLRKMYNAGVIAEVELNRSLADARERSAAADSLRYGVVRLEGEQRTKTSERLAHIEQLTSLLDKLRNERATASVTILRLEEEVDRRRIRAPVDGKLGEVAPLRIGVMVHEGDKLAAVVPSGNLRVVANFAPPAALGRIHPGQSARVRLEGFPWAQYGSVPASVTKVASEIRDGRIRVELALDPHSQSRIPLEHGLPGSVEVEVERISPANLVLRMAGSLLVGPQTKLATLTGERP